MSRKNSKIIIIIVLLSVLFSIEIGFANSSITYDKFADIDTNNFRVGFENIKMVNNTTFSKEELDLIDAIVL